MQTAPVSKFHQIPDNLKMKIAELAFFPSSPFTQQMKKAVPDAWIKRKTLISYIYKIAYNRKQHIYTKRKIHFKSKNHWRETLRRNGCVGFCNANLLSLVGVGDWEMGRIPGEDASHGESWQSRKWERELRRKENVWKRKPKEADKKSCGDEDGNVVTNVCTLAYAPAAHFK